MPDAFELDSLFVKVSELLVATADTADADIDRAVPEVLHSLREKLGMDVVFVSEFVDGERVMRFVDKAEVAPPVQVGDSGELESSYCLRVVDGRLPELVHDAARLPDLPATPFRVGAHLSTPIVLPDGQTYGTLCCFSTAPNEHLRRKDVDTLRMCAQLVARKIDSADRRRVPEWTLAPVEPPTRR
ncbi:GAF domain-containing protein [Piscinibacter sp. HJYY11]|uniref:GAF domain-containing protein n=1 Tax=Piscinibacter sp. HJYY11 TaxID=2801333 RepID=UPI00191EB721|nr:GAF domain-containing protein [Piscinibacter sp. HJYY11]MBL0728896.1 GAF domain-containing protein [Piscinibacter sp. HJYY11]